MLVALVLLTWLWVALPLGALQRAAAESGALVRATLGLLLLSCYALALGPRLGRLLLGPRLGWLRRQPLGGGPWSLALAPWMLLLAGSLLLLVAALHLPAALLAMVSLGPTGAPSLLSLSTSLVTGAVLVAT